MESSAENRAAPASPWKDALRAWGGTLADLRAGWAGLAATDLLSKAIGLAIVTPAWALVLRGLLARTGEGAVADADIARLFLTTRPGLIVAVFAALVAVTLFALTVAALMAIGLSVSSGTPLGPAGAIRFVLPRTLPILRVSARLLLRLLAGCIPLLAGLALSYWFLLRQYDINYYLARRPPAFWIAAALSGVLAAGTAVWLVRWIARVALVLPVLVFEGAAPSASLRASAARSAGRKRGIALTLAAWAAGSIALTSGTTALLSGAGRLLAPHLAGSLALLLAFISVLAALWAVTTLACSVVTNALFALLLMRLFLPGADTGSLRRFAAVPAPTRLRGSRPALAAFGAVALVAGAGLPLVAMLLIRTNRPVLVIAHRGASTEAPENTLASFRLAIEEHADFVELDVQESKDGEVLVVHDSDLMKVGGSPLKIWEATAAELRAVDVGSRAGPSFAGERVPTLAEVLEACRGRIRLIIELKSYGHDERLEERVASLVESAGMVDDCWYMSLDRNMAERMKRLRPAWRVGLLATKTVGDVGAFRADFLAILAKGADLRTVRKVHAAGEVYVWTVNDPEQVLSAMGRGVDGIITDRPAVAREVIARRAAMSDAERILVALLVRLGGTTEPPDSGEELRP